jgi:hypothetical protein
MTTYVFSFGEMCLVRGVLIVALFVVGSIAISAIEPGQRNK